MGKPIWVSEKISVMKSTVMMYLFVGWKIMRDVAKVGKRAWCLLIFFKTVHVKSSNLVRYWGRGWAWSKQWYVLAWHYYICMCIIHQSDISSLANHVRRHEIAFPNKKFSQGSISPQTPLGCLYLCNWRFAPSPKHSTLATPQKRISYWNEYWYMSILSDSNLIFFFSIMSIHSERGGNIFSHLKSLVALVKF